MEQRSIGSSTEHQLLTSMEEPFQADCAAEPFLIVGIGASAGGLESLESFFERVPADCRMAFVVVQHLSPDFKSVMDQLLSRRTTLPVLRVEDGMEVHPGAVYLIPPKKEMIISDGRLLLSDKDPTSALTLPIDVFFRSLAQEAGERAVGIVLSGTGSDGSRGIRDIHESGGLVVAQTVESARFDGMPKSAMDTGIVDLQLPPEEMPAALCRYVDRGWSSDLAPQHLADGLSQILGLLRREYGIDFSHYKANTLQRRLERRAKISHADNIEEYARMLSDRPDELHLLYKDLLIGVTRFFRDAEAFQALQTRILPQLFAHLPPGEELRVWSAACATGEEAYSLAILLDEASQAAQRRAGFRIFATDVHQKLLETATVGQYSAAALEGMDTARMRRYFTPIDGGFRVIRELRERIVFAPHNLLKDAPFTRLDLISCRNFLIYLQPAAQKKVLTLFHFGLKSQGLLFLGLSETPGELSNEFDVVDARCRFFRKSRDIRLPSDPHGLTSPPFSSKRTQASAEQRDMVSQQLDRARDKLVAEFAPPSILVDQEARLIHSFGGGGRFLALADGRSSLCVLDLVSPDLKVVLNGALQRALKENRRIDYGGVPYDSELGASELHICVIPIQAAADEDRRLLITFTPRPIASVEKESDRVDMGDQSRQRIRRLEEELQSTRENLQATLEEMETSNEELQATNEELIASNEELQSTNEELQSVNEELYTVNTEYQRKIGELTQLNADMDNLLASTDVGVIFLDAELRIRKFTPRVANTFHLTPNDIGRRLDTFAHTLDDDQLLIDIEQVLGTGLPQQREVRDRNGTCYLLQIRPYQSSAHVPNGVVLNLINIDSLKQAEKRLRLLSRVFQDGADPIIIEDLDGNILDLNEETSRAYGYSREELIGKPTVLLVPPHLKAHSAELRQRCLKRESLRSVETFRITKNGIIVPVLLTLSLITDETHQAVGIATIAKDISTLKQAEQESQDALRRRDEFLAMLSHELRNPLGGIRNAVQVMLHSEALSEQKEKAAAAIDRQAGHMSRLLNDLLDVTRVTQGKIDFQKEVVDFRRLIEEGVQTVQFSTTQKLQTIRLDFPDTPVWVDADPARLLQVIENLITNASKYTPVKGRIELQLSVADTTCRFVVRDNGRGIEPQLLSQIFELFVQADDTLDRRDGGMGVGLTLVRTLVELHGGTVTAHSAGKDQGTEFVVELPLAQAPLESKQIQENDQQYSPPDLRIVLIEDDPDARNLLQQLLRLEGYQVEAASDGEQGLELIRRTIPDVALVDIGLPRIDGYSIARQLRKDQAHDGTRLVALTGYGRQQDREKVTAAGFDDHLIKPLEPHALRQVLMPRSTKSDS